MRGRRRREKRRMWKDEGPDTCRQTPESRHSARRPVAACSSGVGGPSTALRKDDGSDFPQRGHFPPRLPATEKQSFAPRVRFRKHCAKFGNESEGTCGVSDGRDLRVINVSFSLVHEAFSWMKARRCNGPPQRKFAAKSGWLFRHESRMLAHVKMKLSSWFIGFAVASGFARSR